MKLKPAHAYVIIQWSSETSYNRRERINRLSLYGSGFDRTDTYANTPLTTSPRTPARRRRHVQPQHPPLLRFQPFASAGEHTLREHPDPQEALQDQRFPLFSDLMERHLSTITEDPSARSETSTIQGEDSDDDSDVTIRTAAGATERARQLDRDLELLSQLWDANHHNIPELRHPVLV